MSNWAREEVRLARQRVAARPADCRPIVTRPVEAQRAEKRPETDDEENERD